VHKTKAEADAQGITFYVNNERFVDMVGQQIIEKKRDCTLPDKLSIGIGIFRSPNHSLGFKVIRSLRISHKKVVKHKAKSVIS
jgi:hypothetical protein